MIARFHLLVRVLALLLAVAALPGNAWSQPGGVAHVSARADRASVTPGGQLVIAITFQMQQGWHINPNTPVLPPAWKDLFDPIPTTADVTKSEGVTAGKVQWPEAHLIQWDMAGDGKAEPFGVYEGKAVAFLPLLVRDDAKEAVTVSIEVGYQACKNVCLPPETETLVVKVPVAASEGSRIEPALFGGFDPKGFTTVGGSTAAAPRGGVLPSGISPGAPAPKAGEDELTFNVFGWSFKLDPRGALGLALVTLVALVGGLIMNLTPCVLPIVPLKVMSLTQSGGTRGRVLLLGAVMSLGVIAFWGGMGLIVAVSTSFKSVSQIMGFWYVTLGIGIFIGLMGASMLGAFSVGLPNWVYSIQAGHDSVRGSFVFGILTALLAAPCVAPLWGTVAGWAAFQPPAVTMIVFMAAGLGMALPYFVLAARPQWLSRVPRTGPGSDLLKQVLALLMFAVAAFFVGSALLTLAKDYPWTGGVIHWWVVGLLAAAAGAWLLLRAMRIARTPAGRAMAGVLALIIAGGGVGWAVMTTRDAARAAHGVWRPYTKEAYDAALRSGKVVVVDYTANWCLICQTLRTTVLETAEVQRVLRSEGVVAFEADLSSNEAPGWKALHDLNEVGIPLLTVQGPSMPGPVKSNAYTPNWVIETVNGAGARAVTTK